MKENLLNRKFKYTYSNATFYLIGINVFIFLVTNFVWRNGIYYLSMIPTFVLNGYVYQVFTYMFVHSSFSHIFFNMLSLFIFGQALEKRLGTREFLLYYLLVGTLSGIFSFISYYIAGENAILLGASGAVYGILLLFAVFFPFAKVYIFGLLPIRAPLLIVLFFVIELFSEASGFNGGVAHLTHLAGLVFGYIYCLVRMKINPFDVWKRTL
ncbi:MAG: rhomboid family intramembrane serine protease [Sphaerochaetaceae bacterium]|nr:rhomboid family intramembrane serine protease [Sphaerochaetaceae bacterium]MDC7249336.1 rhomboid family intramembrane serine protease [Sphaerochaetaceae bacterium]